MLKAVIFDWDGTLADTQHAVVNSFQRSLREIGCEVSDEFIRRRIGIGARNTFKEALSFHNITFDEKAIGGLVDNKIRLQLMNVEDVSLFDGAIELLSALNRKAKLALASMNNRAVVNKLLRKNEVLVYFDVIITADEVHRPKPHPEIFLKCASELRCKSQECVVIEDSVFGVKAAKRAKMSCIAIPQGAYSETELREENPNLIVKSINERKRILEFILEKDS